MSFDTNQSAYVALRNIISEHTSGVVFWTGSGLSVEAGLPTWAGLREVLTTALREEINQLDKSDRHSLEQVHSRIQDEPDHWRTFTMLRQHLGDTTWRATIRETLRISESIDPPSIYADIWRINPHGLLTLNLDRLATRSYTQIHPAQGLTEFVGNQAGTRTYVLSSQQPFVCQMHGTIEDHSTWVLTSTDLSYHLSDERYQNFIRSCLSTKTIVLVGITADDIAVGGFLDQLASLNIELGPHYWFTTRRDLKTSQWAEERGIRLIRYDAPDGDHTELKQAFDDLVSFVSVDDPSELPPILPTGLKESEEPPLDQSELLRMDNERLREILNQRAIQILGSESCKAIEDYKAFRREYDQAIYRAWYTRADEGNNLLLGHALQDEVASGAFGTVYRAKDAAGNNVAVKVLHENLRRSEDLLNAFRRGVRSMEILSDNDVQGMVPYRKAFEIPAFVVMDWIEGPNLKEAVESAQVRDWELILRIGSEIADIVRRGHRLPERVLHRDIRPSNVMLRNFYADPYKWEVAVLDFDLSWHKGALEQSVTHGPVFGYLAPEQIQNIPGVSTRHTAVDSFGLGMVLFFMLTENDPIPDQHRHSDWHNTLERAATRRPNTEWISIPNRFVRLIKSATLHSQSERWDMTHIQSELERLLDTALNPTSTLSAELIAEEIAARCEFREDYVWEPNQLQAVMEESSGVKLAVRGDESLRKVLVSVSYGTPGVQGRSSLGKWIGPSAERARDILDSAGWSVEDFRTFYAHISIQASIPARDALRDINNTVDILNRVMAQFRFS